MNDTKATVVAALLDSRGFGQDDEVPADTQAQIVADADAIVAALPEDTGFDFIRVFESWGEREANLTGVLLDLAIATVLVKLVIEPTDMRVNTATVRITTAELRQISERYEIKREETPGGWQITIEPISDEIISEGLDKRLS